MTSQPGKQIVTVHLLRENNKLNIFLKKSYARCGGETSPRESRTSTKCYLIKCGTGCIYIENIRLQHLSTLKCGLGG